MYLNVVINFQLRVYDVNERMPGRLLPDPVIPVTAALNFTVSSLFYDYLLLTRAIQPPNSIIQAMPR